MRRRLAVLAVLPLLALAGCGTEEAAPSAATSSPPVDMGQPLDGVEVTGEVGNVPKVQIEAPLKVQETTSQVITAGEGDPVREGNQALLHIYLANGTTGKQAATTYEQGTPASVMMTDDQFFPAVLDALVGKPTGSRVAVAATPDDAYGSAGAQQIGIGPDDSVLFVVDVMSAAPTDVLDGPEGEPVEDVPASAPSVVEENGTVTRLSFEDAATEPADELQVIPLIEGDGEPVRKGSLVTFDYLGQIYGTDKVFDESYSGEPRTFPVGVNGLIKAWDEGMVGLKEGSRVLIIAPPEFGYGPGGNPQSDPPIKGSDTLAFVVDILGVG